MRWILALAILLSVAVVGPYALHQQRATEDGKVQVVATDACCRIVETQLLAGGAHYARHEVYGIATEEIAYEGNFLDFVSFGTMGQGPARYIVTPSGVYQVLSCDGKNSCRNPVKVTGLPPFFQKIRRMGLKALEAKREHDINSRVSGA